MKRKVEIEKLRKLARFIRKVPKRQFDMKYFATDKNLSLDPECTTAACALGWATVVWPEELVLYRVMKVVGVVHIASGTTSYCAAVEFFGISYDEAWEIFDPCCYRRRSVTRNAVAHRIEKLCREAEGRPMAVSTRPRPSASDGTQPKRNLK